MMAVLLYMLLIIIVIIQSLCNANIAKLVLILAYAKIPLCVSFIKDKHYLKGKLD